MRFRKYRVSLFLFIAVVLVICLFFGLDSNPKPPAWSTEFNFDSIDISELVSKTRKNYKYTAMIAEPRTHPALDFVIGNFAENLDDDWQIIIFHSEDNIDFCKKIRDKHSKNGKIVLLNLHVSSSMSHLDFNRFMYSKELYSLIPTEIFLVFQTDTLINPKGRHLLANFLEYDYVGPPWVKPVESVGNGALSLRRKCKMLEIIEKCPHGQDPVHFMPEDVFFAFGCPQVRPYKPSFEDAKHFGVEYVPEPPFWGVHKPWHVRNVYKELIKEFPDVEILARIHNQHFTETEGSL